MNMKNYEKIGLLKHHQQNSILYRPKEIDDKEEARKALAKVHGKTKYLFFDE